MASPWLIYPVGSLVTLWPQEDSSIGRIQYSGPSHDKKPHILLRCGFKKHMNMVLLRLMGLNGSVLRLRDQQGTQKDTQKVFPWPAASH